MAGLKDQSDLKKRMSTANKRIDLSGEVIAKLAARAAQRKAGKNSVRPVRAIRVIFKKAGK